ncbi:MAG: ATP-binding protein, partial [Methanomassiliicoccales archaeon]
EKIRLRAEERGDVLVLVYEDDGIGIPATDKAAIFQSGYGNNTGLGLHLAREILSITGISISETGETGKGARFEIAVPAGRWRWHT